MVNNPNSVPPSGSGPSGAGGPHADDVGKTHSTRGGFQFKGSHKFAGMTFNEKDWNKLMSSLLQNTCDYINKRMQKATEKMKKAWKKERGEETDD